MPRWPPLSLVVFALAALAGCGDDEPPSPQRPAYPIAAAADPPQKATQKPVHGSLRDVDWKRITIPGSICGASHPIHLRGGLASVRSTRWPEYPRVGVDAGFGRHAHGDIDGDGQDEVALPVDCNNMGGTADGVLAFAQIIFTPGAGGPEVMGIITPRQRELPHELPTLLVMSLGHGYVRSNEDWYGPRDATCCPSGHSQTIWTYDSGELKPGPTRVFDFPAGAPSPPCDPSDLKLTYANTGAGGGTTFVYFGVGTSAKRSCSVRGFPQIEVLDEKGQALPFRYRRMGNGKSDPRVKPISLSHERTGEFALEKYRCDVGVKATGARVEVRFGEGPDHPYELKDLADLSGLDFCKPFKGESSSDPGNTIGVLPLRAAHGEP